MRSAPDVLIKFLSLKKEKLQAFVKMMLGTSTKGYYIFDFINDLDVYIKYSKGQRIYYLVSQKINLTIYLRDAF